VTAKAARRRSAAAEKLRVLREADRCTKPGELGALLRREGTILKKHTLRLGLLVCLAAASIGCDPGVHYRPRDWTQVDAVHWRTFVGGVYLTMRPIGGFIGETWLYPDIEAKNQTAVAVTIENAALQCDRVSYPADSVGLSGTKSLLAPGETRKLNLRWRFQKPIGDVLHPPVSILLTLRVGDDSQAVAIPMTHFFYK
jgi:hypothetical protein